VHLSDDTYGVILYECPGSPSPYGVRVEFWDVPAAYVARDELVAVVSSS
jgi:hypothetical protein